MGEQGDGEGAVGAMGADVMVRWEVLPLGSYKARRFGMARGDL